MSLSFSRSLLQVIGSVTPKSITQGLSKKKLLAMFTFGFAIRSVGSMVVFRCCSDLSYYCIDSPGIGLPSVVTCATLEPPFFLFQDHSFFFNMFDRHLKHFEPTIMILLIKSFKCCIMHQPLIT